MSERARIIGIYVGVALLSAAILGTAMWLRRRVPEPDMASIVDRGRGRAESWFELKHDLELVNQAGERVRLSDLRGKVWVAAEFFAVCPKCAARNGADLRAIYDEFKGDPGFHFVCISVDPEADTVDKLAAYATALGADVSDWWFLTGERQAIHDWLRNEMKFLDIRERKDPAEIEQLGRYQHDMGLVVVDRRWRVIGKRDLAWAREEGGEAVYQTARDELRGWIRSALAAGADDEAAGEAAAP